MTVHPYVIGGPWNTCKECGMHPEHAIHKTVAAPAPPDDLHHAAYNAAKVIVAGLCAEEYKRDQAFIQEAVFIILREIKPLVNDDKELLDWLQAHSGRFTNGGEVIFPTITSDVTKPKDIRQSIRDAKAKHG